MSDRLRIAVFIDFDNIEIGVKNTLGATFDAGIVLEALKERGEVVSKLAYSDWQRATGYSRMLSQHAIRMVQRNLTPGGDKNGADINLALDALEMAFTHSHINAFVIVAGDSDFISLVEKLKQYDKKVFVVGGRQFTSGILQRNCHEFIAYENLLGVSSGGGGQRRQRDDRSERPAIERAPIEQAIPLVTRALKVLSERELSPHLGLLKSTMVQLDSTFSERSYGAGSFRDFVQKLEKLGVVRQIQTKGGWLVEPADGSPSLLTENVSRERDDVSSAVAQSSSHEAPSVPAGPPQNAARPPAPPIAGPPADGVRELRTMLASAQVRRWPMYLRNVKQMIRDVNPAFDERAYGFGNLVDLLRAAHRDGVVRVDRDRQGVIRVFQGTAPVIGSGDQAEAPSQESSESQPISAADEGQEQRFAEESETANGNGEARYEQTARPRRHEHTDGDETGPRGSEPGVIEHPDDIDASDEHHELPGDNIGNREPRPSSHASVGAPPKSRRRRPAPAAAAARTARPAARRPRKPRS